MTLSPVNTGGNGSHSIGGLGTKQGKGDIGSLC